MNDTFNLLASYYRVFFQIIKIANIEKKFHTEEIDLE